MKSSTVHLRAWPSAVALGLLGFLLIGPVLAAASNEDYAARVNRVLAATPLIDGHNDLPWEIRCDRKGTSRRSTCGRTRRSSP